MSFPAADAPRLTAALAPVVAADVATEDADLAPALAYIATAEGSAATIAERACDRAGLDYATCPAEILDAAERRAEELATPEVPPEVQAVLDARAAVVVAEAAAKVASRAFLDAPSYRTSDAAKDADRTASEARKALWKLERATYVPGATPDEDRRAFWNRHQGLTNEIGAIEFTLETATKKGQKKAMERHTATIARLKVDLAAFDAAHKHWSDPD